MENLTCSNCKAALEPTTEFCNSCGEWQGVNPGSNEESTKEPEKIKRVTKLTTNQLNDPIPSFQSNPVPTRKEVPGIRAVFFIAIIIPIIAGASYWYNSNKASQVVEESIEIDNLTTTSTTTTVAKTATLTNLKKWIINCSSSSQYGPGYSCTNLFDGTKNSWQDASQSCKDGYIIFEFNEEVNINFFILQNIEDNKPFTRNYKVKEIEINTDDPNYYYRFELENINSSQWIDIVPVNTTTFQISFLSAYPGEEVSGANPFLECAIQEIEIYGYPPSSSG